MTSAQYKRPFVAELEKALRDNIPFLHAITGPRQSGKTTAAAQAAKSWRGEVVFAAADAPLPPGPEWIHAQWANALSRCVKGQKVLLILDEVQKVKGWSEIVKLLWDKEKRERKGIRAVLLGSSTLLMQKGLSESLAGRFVTYRCNHWGLSEMRRAFGWNMDEWIFFGGYPGAAPLKKDESAWRRYVTDSLIETVLSRDVLQLTTVAKPALLRHLFGLAVAYPAQILSYNKMLGQLQDAGNTTTLAHYLHLLETAFLVSGLNSFRSGRGRKRAGSPKLVFWNNALVTAYSGDDFSHTRQDLPWWGRLVENAVGGQLLNGLDRVTHQVLYWRDGNDEVDFVIKTPRKFWAVEVKSGRDKPGQGLSAFLRQHPQAQPFIIGPSGMPLEEFFMKEPAAIFD
ncbi:MAG TPA: ATP-binding protein [Elusimicrobiota bacterium]|nr:ATP-binding protein [Elusimicrobiota bacterium]